LTIQLVHAKEIIEFKVNPLNFNTQNLQKDERSKEASIQQGREMLNHLATLKVRLYFLQNFKLDRPDIMLKMKDVKFCALLLQQIQLKQKTIAKIQQHVDKIDQLKMKDHEKLQQKFLQLHNTLEELHKILEIEEGQKYLQKPKDKPPSPPKQEESPIQEHQTTKAQSTSEEENSDDEEYYENLPGMFFTDFWINPEETIDASGTDEMNSIRELLKLTRPPSTTKFPPIKRSPKQFEGRRASSV
jgi:hypothetical protein